MTEFKTDKVHPHGYMPSYMKLVNELGPAAVVCEVGVHAGGSLAMWQELFPQGVIIGVDINEDSHWPDGTHRVIAWQDDPGLAGMVAEYAPDGCDLIIDDASHIGRLTAATFSTLWQMVKPGGFYVVEDWADPWVEPRWGVADPSDRLVDYVPVLITTLKEDAETVTYTREGLAIIKKGFLSGNRPH